MNSTELDQRPGPASLLLVMIGTTAAVGAIGCWLFVSWFMWAIRCDDVCGGDDADKWQWTGQLFLAVPGCALGLVALVLGLAGLRPACRVALVGAASCAVLWLLVLSTF